MDSLFKTAQNAGMLSDFFVGVYGYNFQTPADGQMLLAVLNKDVELFPDSTDALEDLASVYQSKGMKDLALKTFQKLLALNPQNSNAARRIKELQK